MKKILTYAAVAMIGLTTISSCSKKSDSSPSYTMKATVGTTAVSTSSCIASLNAGTLVITGYNGSASTTPPYLNISISSFTGAATYTLDSTALIPTVTCGYYPDLVVTNYKIAKSGSIVVTSSSSSSVAGTFSFKCTDGTSISGGTFTAKRN